MIAGVGEVSIQTACKVCQPGVKVATRIAYLGTPSVARQYPCQLPWGTHQEGISIPQGTDFNSARAIQVPFWQAPHALTSM